MTKIRHTGKGADKGRDIGGGVENRRVLLGQDLVELFCAVPLPIRFRKN